MALFYASTTIMLGNGRKTPFWHAPWLGGRAPIDIAPLIYDISKRKKCMVAKAIADGAWVDCINMDGNFSMDHLSQFVDLWTQINNVQLDEEMEDDISWKFTENGQYSAASAYQAQFLGLVHSVMDTIVWKTWAPPKVKHHAWLVLQNRLWTADRLQNRGWPNCGLCPLCKQVTESSNHLFVHCRFTVRIWELLKQWLGLIGVNPSHWAGLSTNEWWSQLASGSSPQRKALASLLLLTVWEIWNERNARVFKNKSSPTFVILEKIKCEARLWVYAGARNLGSIMPGE
jgi:hypothetical protein